MGVRSEFNSLCVWLSSVSDTWRGPHSLAAQSALRHCGRSRNVQKQPHSVWCQITVERASPALKLASPTNNHSERILCLQE